MYDAYGLYEGLLMSMLCYVRTKPSYPQKWVYTRNGNLKMVEDCMAAEHILVHGFYQPTMAYYTHCADMRPSDDMTVEAFDSDTKTFLPSFEYDVGGVDWLTLSKAYIAVWGTHRGGAYMVPKGRALAASIISGVHSVLYPNRYTYARLTELIEADDGLSYQYLDNMVYPDGTFSGLVEARTEAATVTLMLAGFGPVVRLDQFRT